MRKKQAKAQRHETQLVTAQFTFQTKTGFYSVRVNDPGFEPVNVIVHAFSDYEHFRNWGRPDPKSPTGKTIDPAWSWGSYCSVKSLNVTKARAIVEDAVKGWDSQSMGRKVDF